MLTGYNSVSRGMINLKLTLIPSIILKLQAQRGFLSKNMNPQSYKSQYMALPESNCWYKISAYKWQPTLDKPTILALVKSINVNFKLLTMATFIFKKLAPESVLRQG